MDDFSQRNNRWALEVKPEGIVYYDQESMRILISHSEAEYWTTPQIPTKNAIIEVTTDRIAGPLNNTFGIVCRLKDARNYYAFLASSDGYFGIIKNENGERELLSGDSFMVSNAIRKDGLNHLHAECIDDSLRFSINWQNVAEVEDDTFIEGDSGILAGTLSEPGTDIRFDNFVITIP
jgi:hypothetical protein